MKCNFNKTTTREKPFIHLENHEWPHKGYFKYFDSMLNAYSGSDEDVQYRIAAGWLT